MRIKIGTNISSPPMAPADSSDISGNRIKMLRRLFKKSNSLNQNEASIPQEQKFQANAGTFRRLFKKYVIPFLEENDWRGTGFKFYKETNNETVYLLEVVPEKRGGGYSVALAIHFNFIPYRFAEKIEEYKCSGLDVRSGFPFGNDDNSRMLKYPTTQTEIVETFNFLKEQLVLAETSCFNKYGNWKEYYLQFTPELINNREQELKRITNSRFSLLCAQIFDHMDMNKRSIEMAEYGLSIINYPTGNGSALYPEFMKIINAANRD